MSGRGDWWATGVVHPTSLDDAITEIAEMRKDWQKLGEALGLTDFTDPEVIINRAGSAWSVYSGRDKSIGDLQDDVTAFASKTFGPGRQDAAWKKLFEEIGETLKDPRNPGEWADVFIILFDLAALYGIRVGPAIQGKMLALQDRIWRKTETGTFQHVPDGAPRPARTEFVNPTRPPVRVEFRVVFQDGPFETIPDSVDAHVTWSNELIYDTAEGEYQPPSRIYTSDLEGGYRYHKWLTPADMGSAAGQGAHLYKWDPKGGIF